jgi:menaquinone-dependent protoporphyrinogen oxidase
LKKGVKMNVLIVYASKYGCTEKCARLIAKELNNQADLIDLTKEKDFDISGYDNVIIGGPVYMGKIKKEVSVFCSDNLNELREKRIGLFICGMAEDKAAVAELNQNFPPELLEIAVAKEHLGGEFLLNKMNFMDKVIVKKVSKVTSDKSNIMEDKIHEFAQAFQLCP